MSRRLAHELSGLVGLALLAPALLGSDNWPQWRGPLGSGEAAGADPPTRWSETENVGFKVALPGLGSSTPAVWGDLIFVTIAIDTGKNTAGVAGTPDAKGRVKDNVHQWAVLALRRADGSEVWRRVVRSGPTHEGAHPDATWSSNSPVTDGERVYAFFGSQGLYALDLTGTVLWERDFGDMTTRNAFGEGASPAVWGDRLVVQWDHEGESFLFVLDKRTGEEVWQKRRDEFTSWATPVVVEHGGKAQVITSASRAIRSYDLEGGELLWQATGMTVNVIPSPIVRDGMAYFLSGFRGSALLAIKLDGAAGDVTNTANVSFRYDRDTPYVPSALLYQDRLYFLKVNSALLSVVDAKSGQPVYGPQRLDGLTNVYASPVAAAGRVYLVDRDGAALVLRAGDRYEVLASNQLDDQFDASPVLVGRDLLLRGRRHLYALRAP